MATTTRSACAAARFTRATAGGIRSSRDAHGYGAKPRNATRGPFAAQDLDLRPACRSTRRRPASARRASKPHPRAVVGGVVVGEVDDLDARAAAARPRSHRRAEGEAVRRARGRTSSRRPFESASSRLTKPMSAARKSGATCVEQAPSPLGRAGRTSEPSTVSPAQAIVTAPATGFVAPGCAATAAQIATSAAARARTRRMTQF